MLSWCLTQMRGNQRLEEIRCIAGKSMVSVLVFLVGIVGSLHNYITFKRKGAGVSCRGGSGVDEGRGRLRRPPEWGVSGQEQDAGDAAPYFLITAPTRTTVCS